MQNLVFMKSSDVTLYVVVNYDKLLDIMWHWTTEKGVCKFLLPLHCNYVYCAHTL